MSELVCIAYPDPNEADRALDELERLQHSYLVDLADAAVVIRRPDGEVKIKQSVNLVGATAVSGGVWGSLWGILIGLLFLNPLAGLLTGGAAGAGLGALSGALTDYGINDDFIRELGSTIEPNSSALFVLMRNAKVDRLLDELEPRKGRVLRTSLSKENEERLRRFLSDHHSDVVAA